MACEADHKGRWLSHVGRVRLRRRSRWGFVLTVWDVNKNIKPLKALAVDGTGEHALLPRAAAPLPLTAAKTHGGCNQRLQLSN